MPRKTQKFKDVVDAHRWIMHHPAFWRSYRESPAHPWRVMAYEDAGIYAMEIMPMRVNPETRRVDEDDTKNTFIEYWVETGHAMVHNIYGAKYDNNPENEQCCHCHDWRIDCGGDSYDEAIFNIAKKIRRRYGDYHIDHEKDTVTLFYGGKSKKFVMKDYRINYKYWATFAPWCKRG